MGANSYVPSQFIWQQTGVTLLTGTSWWCANQPSIGGKAAPNDVVEDSVQFWVFHL